MIEIKPGTTEIKSLLFSDPEQMVKDLKKISWCFGVDIEENSLYRLMIESFVNEIIYITKDNELILENDGSESGEVFLIRIPRERIESFILVQEKSGAFMPHIKIIIN